MRRLLLRTCVRALQILKLAHRRGVLHRDVSPANIWIAKGGRVFLLDWECAYFLDSPSAPFRLGTVGYSERSQEKRVPVFEDDWLAFARVVAFVLTGMDPSILLHGDAAEIEHRMVVLTGLHAEGLVRSLASVIADDAKGCPRPSSFEREFQKLMNNERTQTSRLRAPLFLTSSHESVLGEALAKTSAAFRRRLRRLSDSKELPEASQLDAHSGIAGLLYSLSAAHATGILVLKSTDGECAARLLLGRTKNSTDLPGLINGRAGRALAVAMAERSGILGTSGSAKNRISRALGGRLDWPDFTHGAAGQGIAALACGRLLSSPALARRAARCKDFLVRTQQADGSWALPRGVGGVTGEQFTGFAHGVAGIMAFLSSYATCADDPVAQIAWRRAESWLVAQARRTSGKSCRWPQSMSLASSSHWWCHGTPGIALGWLTAAREQGIDKVNADHLNGALDAIPRRLRSESLGFCHGLAGIGEVFLDAHSVLGGSQWQQAAAEIVTLLLSMFRRRFRPSWHCVAEDTASACNGLMLGEAGIVHFLLRAKYPSILRCPPMHG